MNGDEVEAADRINVAIAEFNALRAEIVGRSTAQHTLLNLNLAATTAVCAVAFANPSARTVLLVLPVLSCLFGLLYYDHGAVVAMIGRYIRDKLAPELRRCSGWGLALWWEGSLAAEARRRSGAAKAFAGFDLPVILAFVAVPLIVTSYMLSVVDGILGWSALLVGFSAEVIVIYAGVRAARRWRSDKKSGPGHPDTLISRDNLAGAYREAGDLGRAIPLYEATLADRQRVLGPDHPDTLTSRDNLAGAYREAGDLGRAIALYKATLADAEPPSTA